MPSALGWPSFWHECAAHRRGRAESLLAWVVLALAALFMALGWWHAIAIKLSLIATSALLLILFWMWRRNRRVATRGKAGVPQTG